jgi:hypothetical protein
MPRMVHESPPRPGMGVPGGAEGEGGAIRRNAPCRCLGECGRAVERDAPVYLKRSALTVCYHELPRIPLPRTPVNKGI